jgi:ribosomal protein L37AE/L43A
MKTLEQARREYVCPKCRHKDFLAFNAETVYCFGCKEQRDLGMNESITKEKVKKA